MRFPDNDPDRYVETMSGPMTASEVLAEREYERECERECEQDRIDRYAPAVWETHCSTCGAFFVGAACPLCGWRAER